MLAAHSKGLQFGLRIVQNALDFLFDALLLEMGHVSYERQIEFLVQALHFLTSLNRNRVDIRQNRKQCEMISLADGRLHAGYKRDHLSGFIVSVGHHDGRMAHPLAHLSCRCLIKVIPCTRFVAEESFEVALEYDCALAIKQPIFRVVFTLPDERRVAVVGWHPGDNQYLNPGVGLLRWRIDGGILYPRKYVLHASISTWDGVVYDTHYGICELLIQAKDLGPVLRLTDDLSACLQYKVEHES